MELIETLKADPRVDHTSLMKKVKAIQGKDSLDEAEDLKAETRSAHELLKLEDVSCLEFSETPDIKITLENGNQIGVEVRRIRPKPEDISDEKRLLEDFTLYGKPRSNPHRSLVFRGHFLISAYHIYM